MTLSIMEGERMVLWIGTKTRFKYKNQRLIKRPSNQEKEIVQHGELEEEIQVLVLQKRLPSLDIITLT
jgi:hypothetical protein